MRLRLSILAASFLAPLFACSLVTDLSGLAGPVRDASPDALEAGADALEAGADVKEASDAPDARPPTYPSTPVLDDFERADGPLGSSWTSATDTNRYTGSWVVEARRARYLQQGTSGGCGDAMSVWSGAFGGKQEIYATLSSVPNYGRIVLSAKLDAAESDRAAVTLDIGAGTAQLSAGPPEAYVGPSFAMKVGAGDQVGARFHPDGRVEIFRNGVVVAERTWSGDTSRGGRVAIEASCASNGSGTVLDDVGGGDVP